ncbi:MAG: hypothetical protein J5598_02730, partial [Clostridia bacterium]|nr:hypothetical protein [Clostridia bacterium]
NCRDEFAKNHDVTHAGIVDDFFNAVSAGKTGNMLADQVQKCRATMKLTNANIVDILNKIKDFQVLMGSKK